MSNYDRNNKSGGRGKYNSNQGSGRSGGSRFGGGGRSGGGRPEMHHATCSDCGIGCEVPFKPTGNKPVLCSNCFSGGDSRGSRGGGRDRGGFENRNGGRSNFGDRQMHSAVCEACGNKCEVPFRPTGDKPVYCSNCFAESKGNSFGSDKNNQFNEHHEQMSKKLDKIIQILERIAPPKEHVIKKKDAMSELSVVEDSKKESVKKKKKVSAKKTVNKTASKKPAKKTSVKKKVSSRKKAKK